MMLEAAGICIGGRLHDAAVQVRGGAVTAICGPNGAGKSTLLGVLAGLIAPDAGSVTLDGAPLATLDAAERARRIGYLPQAAEVAWNLSVRTLVGLGRLPHRTGAAADARAVSAALSALGLEELAQRPLSTLSGGERARALLARVLATQSQWILADEPLAALDLAQQRAQLRHLRALVASDHGDAVAGVGVVLVVHDLALAMNHADHVVVLDKGRVAASGAPLQALSPEVIATVWGIEAEWLGDTGHRALRM